MKDPQRALDNFDLLFSIRQRSSGWCLVLSLWIVFVTDVLQTRDNLLTTLPPPFP